MHIFQAQQRAYTMAVEKGFHEEPLNIDQKLMLTVGELVEAQNELRDGHEPRQIYYNGEKPEGFGIELADAVIRIFDLCGALDIDLETAIAIKTRYNATRPHKHGKAF